MDKVYVVYWSQTGNTQAMADAIGKGVTDAGKEAEVVYVGSADIDALKAAKGFALGCPGYGSGSVGRDGDGTFCRRGRGLCSRQNYRIVWFLRLGRWRVDA